MRYQITTIARSGRIRTEWVWLNNDLNTATLGKATYRRVAEKLWAASSVPQKTIQRAKP